MDIFEQIIKKKISADVFFENKKIIAFYDINPITKGHFLVVPKLFSKNLIDIDDETFKELMITAKELAKEKSKEMEVDGFKLVVNSGTDSGQEVMRTHIHIIPSERK